jgi:CHAT domain-containing protein
MSQFMKKSLSQLYMLFILTLYSLALAAAQPVADPGKIAFEHFQRGDFIQAVQAWELVRSELSMDDLVLLAMAYQSLGHLNTAYNILVQLCRDAPRDDPASRANVLSHLSELYIAMGNLDLGKKDLDVVQICRQQKTVQKKNPEKTVQKPDYVAQICRQQKTVQEKNLDKAMKYVTEAETLAQNESSLMANILNTKGNVLVAQGDLLNIWEDEKAAEKYAEALSLYKTSVQQAGDNVLRAKILTNIVQAMAKSGNRANIEFNEVWQQVRTLPNSHDKAFALMSLAQFLAPGQKLLAHEILIAAIQVANVVKNKRSVAYAKGYLAQLYAEEKRYPEAIRLAREAIFQAQSYPELLYRLEWQLGKYLRAQKNNEGAMAIYRSAVEHAKSFQDRCHSVSQPFRQKVETLYFEWADLLLQQAALENNTDKSLLEEARESIESFKKVELQNYFQDDCVTELENKSKDLSKDLPNGTAILYPISFDDRIELLLSFKTKDAQVQTLQLPPSHIGKERLTQEIDKFLENIDVGERLKTMSRRKRAQKTLEEWIEEWLPEFRKADYVKNLYQWLIEPINNTLKQQGIKTLVIVPDGKLRTLPFAALYNGKKFLIEDYALAVIPGLQLTDFKSISHRNIKALLTGLSVDITVETGKYSALQAEKELTKISKHLPNNKTLLNKKFVIDNVKSQLEQTSYSVVHFATHGHFAKNPNNTFLLTYDAKDNPSALLRMNCLEALISMTEFRKKPVELLTFSACESALGDKRAALGLAGVALKSGARSALATLWSVNDTATITLVKYFYEALSNNFTKAQALQEAQKKLLMKHFKDGYEHPYYWGAFLLIGNWK